MNEAVERQLAALARRQHGYTTRRQLLQLGLGAKAIDYRVRSGRLIPVYAGVYAVGHLPTLPLDRAHAALLACGGRAVLSHGSAASAWGIFREWRMPFEVSVPTARRRPGIEIHRAALTREEIRHSFGLWLTSPARTVLDLAPRLEDRRLIRVVDDLRVRALLRLEHLAQLVGRNPRHAGARRLRPLIERPRGPSRSDFELEFIAFCERYGLPESQLNAIVAGREVDVFFPIEQVIVELDGWDFHCSRTSFNSDRDKDAQMLAHGLPTVRITWERLIGAPDREAKRLHAILARRRDGAA